jgi:hypothetical protein
MIRRGWWWAGRERWQRSINDEGEPCFTQSIEAAHESFRMKTESNKVGREWKKLSIISAITIPFGEKRGDKLAGPPPYKEWRGAQVLILSSRHDTHESFITPESISSNNSQSSYWKSITLYFSYYLFYIYIYILSNKFSILLFVFFKYYFV